MLLTKEKEIARACADRLLDQITFDNVSEVSMNSTRDYTQRNYVTIKVIVDEYLMERITESIGVIKKRIVIKFQEAEIIVEGWIDEFSPDNMVTLNENYESMIHATVYIVRTDKGKYNG
jgi:hypothetical protein